MHEELVIHRLKLRELRILLAVSLEGSMAKAARKLAISQPAVSRAIADMETTLGVTLLSRNPQGVEPTAYGHALLKRGVAVFDELKQGVREIEFIADPTAGEVRIGGTPATAVGLIAAVIDRMSRKYPRIRFNVTTGEAAMLYDTLRERNLDIVIARMLPPFTEEDIEPETLYEDQMVVVAATKNPWSRRRKIKLADLLDEPWTLLPPGTRLGSAILDAFRANGARPPRVTVTTSSGHLRETLLATGRFLTVMQESLLYFPVRHPSLKVLYQPAELLTLQGFPNRVRHDSRWQTEGVCHGPSCSGAD